MLIHAACANG
jgi:hypothetical protein